jgi:hypothetical protein
MNLEHIALIVAALAGSTAALLRAYDWVYLRGYTAGHHTGFTEGLYRAAERTERTERQKTGRIARKLVALSV